MDRNPNTQLRFISAEKVLDFKHREAVIGIRNQRPELQGLAIRKLGNVSFAGYATDGGVKTWATVIGTTPSALWVSENTKEDDQIEINNPRNALDLAIAGTAIAILPTFIGDTISTLRRVIGPIEELAHEQWLVTHQDDRFVPEVRTTIDRIVELISKLHKNS